MTDSNAIPSIVLPPDFHFNQVKPHAERLLAPLNFAPPLGVLSNFHGDFKGVGFNMIFRPQNGASMTKLPKTPHGPNDNILELNLTDETLSFSGSLGSVPNRGMAQGDIFLNGVPYVQKIDDVTFPPAVTIHFEPGIWLSVPLTTDPNEPPTFARMASIPHGTTINLQGTASSAANGPPTIPPVDPTPFLIASKSPIRFPSQTASDDATFRIPQDLHAFIADGKITQAILDDPNTVLRHAIAGQTIVNTVTLTVESAPETPAGPLHIPAEGGGNANIAFLTKNALVPNLQPGPSAKGLAGVKSTFWIETVEHELHIPVFHAGQRPLTMPSAPHPVLGLAGPKFVIDPPFAIPHPITIKLHSTQIQYSQVVLLNFNGLCWPHVSVATLVPATPVKPAPVVWDAIRKVA